MGDLNFRLAEDTFGHEQIVESVKNGEFGRLLGKDQLTLVRREEQAFHELSEKLPNFAPTYKFVIGTEEYDKKYVDKFNDTKFTVNTYVTYRIISVRFYAGVIRRGSYAICKSL